MKKKRKVEITYTRNEVILQIAFILLLIFTIGGVCNFVAVANNDGRMPILMEGDGWRDGTHFTYNNPFEIKYWMLTDIFNIKETLYFSIGDILIFIGYVSGPMMIWFQIRKYKEAKKLLSSKTRRKIS